MLISICCYNYEIKPKEVGFTLTGGGTVLPSVTHDVSDLVAIESSLFIYDAYFAVGQKLVKITRIPTWNVAVIH